MNDKTTAVLEKYDIEVLRSWKGRGAILCETKTGIKILKEYRGSPQRLAVQHKLLQIIKEQGAVNAEEIIPSKEGELVAKDEDMTSYYLKEYREGRECNIRECRDCCKAAEQMAVLHKVMEMPEFADENNMEPYFLPREFEKHNRELRRIKKYLKEKRQKNEFEYYLYQYFDNFLNKAEKIQRDMEDSSSFFSEETLKKRGNLCHGDLQHHNVLFTPEGIFFINFDKFVLDNPMRDFSLFFRKMMEKNNWSEEYGRMILQSYQKKRKFTEEEKYQLYCRLSYPEKFWKIADFYYNSPKTWIPEKNMEKLKKIWIQEEEKTLFLEKHYENMLC